MQPKLQDELNFPLPINIPALFEPITIYVSNLEYLAVAGVSDYMQLYLRPPTIFKLFFAQ